MIVIAQAEFDDDSLGGVTLEWIQTLPPELKDTALYRLCRAVESKPTLVESFSLNQVMYRTISGGTFTESADHVAKRTGCDRKTILKGLSIAVSQNILGKSDRPGTSSEYFFKPVEEWEPEPVHITDTRTKKVLEFPRSLEESQDFTVRQLDSVETELVLNVDSLETDSNNVVVLKDKTTTVSVYSEDTSKSSHWKYVGQGLPRVYFPPELDADTGLKIESIHSATKEPRQFIIRNAVDLLYNQLVEIPSIELEQKISSKSTIPDDVMQALEEAGIHLNLGVSERLWLKYSDSFEDAISYTVAQGEAGKIKQSKEGFFRKSLEEGWSFTLYQNQKRCAVSIRSLTEEQQQWYNWACVTGVCDDVPVRNLPEKMGQIAVLIPIKDRRPVDPPHDLVIIDVAMREYPMN
ncbi:MAG: hypothetical protein PUP91_32310 [Rhizonema sp. PD37]|nr:hypothetical protein [Rhizonema sp. PD37]